MKTIILDNYDSFTFNLYQYVGEIDERPLVFRNDGITLKELKQLAPDRIIVSPGPGNPEDPAPSVPTGHLELGPTIPILGVCLGHQGIVHAFGGRVVRAPQAMHGKTSYVFHDDESVFFRLPRTFEAMRYHSLVGEPGTLPACLEVTARTWDNIIMGVRHREYPIHGVQFHPESIGITIAQQLLQNFILLGERLHRRPQVASAVGAY